MKKLRNIFMISALVFTLAACSSSADNNANSASDDQTKELTVWVHVSEDDPEGEAYALRAREFEEMHEDVKVNIEHIIKTGGGSGYNDRLNAAIQSGNLPDVFTMESVHVASFVNSNLLLPLSDHLEQDVINSYLDTIVKFGSVEDNLYALQSFELSAPVFFNVDLFEAAGIEIPADENGNWTLDLAWSFEEFLENTRILKEYMGQEPVNMLPDNTGWQMYAHSAIIFSNNGQLTGENGLDVEGYLNSENTIEALKFIETLFSEGLAPSITREDAFATGQAAISFEGPWMIDVLDSEFPDVNWSLMPYPFGQEGHNSAPHGTWYVAASADTEYPELVSELVAHLTNAESAKALEEALGVIPGHTQLLDESVTFSEYPRRLMLEQLVNTAHLKPVSPIFPVLEDVLGNIVEGIALGSDSVENLVANEINRVEREASRFR